MKGNKLKDQLNNILNGSPGSAVLIPKEILYNIIEALDNVEKRKDDE